MKLHRFYIHEMHNKFGPIALGKELWIHDERLLHQWLRVLRLQIGNEVVLFNDTEERLYKVVEIEAPLSVKLELVTELERKIPGREIYVLWSLIKNYKHDWVLQKATELGAHKFVPIVAGRSEKTGFNVDRAHKIVIEAAEQCGRADIPEVREPITIQEAMAEYTDTPLFICEQHSTDTVLPAELDKLGILIGPEGGWTDEEKVLFKNHDLMHIALSNFTLRAETATVVAVSKLVK